MYDVSWMKRSKYVTGNVNVETPHPKVICNEAFYSLKTFAAKCQTNLRENVKFWSHIHSSTIEYKTSPTKSWSPVSTQIIMISSNWYDIGIFSFNKYWHYWVQEKKRTTKEQNQIKGEKTRRKHHNHSPSTTNNLNKTLWPRDVARQKRAMHEAPHKYVENINHIKWKHEIILGNLLFVTLHS